MDVTTLILLGAAGGLLRGALDLYTRFVSWQADRRIHRQLAAAGTAEVVAPQFKAYFDPAVDTVAAIVHSVMGAGAAVLFGTTGQISGGYAALVVGISAPMLLTQLGRIQTVNEAVMGERQPAGAAAEAEAPPTAAASAVGAVGAGDSGAVDSPPQVAQPSAPSAGRAVRPSTPTEGASSVARAMPAPRQHAPAADERTPEPASGELPEEATRLPDPMRSSDTPLPANPPDGTGPGFGDRGAPRWRQGPALGEEGL
ncbi:hypothetical protein [Streptomyces solicathayae]|uniref:ABC transmembrane type-1 domain-containing protein n=1 Tax=Streptomyces solicathayae TaxID=3081768 RepID=A0ABZ0LM02_9ACTN|nr:hypothetical protein [Streptomyces sp. HUAS YS2]WOX19888.1 hypothetical protein R2D22_00060 [Streptomyces sp. HUAS YS2]WOX26490.1 hypothetical protein R2D22_36000 [Streptomyces sp. HUAS YS2]